MVRLATENNPMVGHLVDVQWCVEDPGQMPDGAIIQRWTGTCCDQLKLEPVEICVRVVGEAEMQSLNQRFRNQDKLTNVLSFSREKAAQQRVDENGRVLLGDIIICMQVVQKESQLQGKSVDAHFAHLLIHGLLHLQGYDHWVDDQANEMEAVEKSLMRNLGYDDPYE